MGFYDLIIKNQHRRAANDELGAAKDQSSSDQWLGISGFFLGLTSCLGPALPIVTEQIPPG
jgi:hypothetical protein